MIYLKTVFIVLFLSVLVNLTGQVYTYSIKENQSYTIKKQKRADGFTFEIKDQLSSQTVITDIDYNTQKWRYISESKNTQVEAVRIGNKIILKGTSDEEELFKEFRIDENPWKQILPSDLLEFLNGAKEIVFWGIATQGPAYLDVGKMEAKYCGIEEMLICNEKIMAIKLEIGLAGWTRIFWEEDFWLNKENGDYIKSSDNIELISKKKAE